MLGAINVILVAGMVLVSALFYRYVAKISELVTQMKRDVEELQNSKAEEPRLLAQEPGLRVAIEIVDPVALAKRESKLAQVAADIAPNLVAREVYKQIREEIALAVEKRGIDANVTIIML